jgi:hypothetical protein
MTDAPTKIEQTHISMIIDRSGSMADCAVETIGAVNGYLDSARKDDALGTTSGVSAVPGRQRVLRLGSGL